MQWTHKWKCLAPHFWSRRQNGNVITAYNPFGSYILQWCGSGACVCVYVTQTHSHTERHMQTIAVHSLIHRHTHERERCIVWRKGCARWYVLSPYAMLCVWVRKNEKNDHRWSCCVLWFAQYILHSGLSVCCIVALFVDCYCCCCCWCCGCCYHYYDHHYHRVFSFTVLFHQTDQFCTKKSYK